MMRRRFRRRASWTYSDSQQMLIQNGSSTSYVWLLPPGRVQFLLNQQRRDRLTFAGAHLWLTFYWKSVAGSSAGNLPDADFGIFKSTIADAITNVPDITPMESQWNQPSTPGSLTTWEDDDDDGTNPFLWQHHIKGMSPPNACVGTFGLPSSNVGFNQTDLLGAGTADSPLFACRKFSVTQEWQPDVVVRSKRRLQKGEGVLLAMGGVPGFGQEIHCEVKLRSLTS